MDRIKQEQTLSSDDINSWKESMQKHIRHAIDVQELADTTEYQERYYAGMQSGVEYAVALLDKFLNSNK